MLSVEIKENDKVVGELAAAEKLFKTGSRGFFGMGKIQIGEKRYQGKFNWWKSVQNRKWKRKL